MFAFLVGVFFCCLHPDCRLKCHFRVDSFACGNMSKCKSTHIVQFFPLTHYFYPPHWLPLCHANHNHRLLCMSLCMYYVCLCAHTIYLDLHVNRKRAGDTKPLIKIISTINKSKFLIEFEFGKSTIHSRIALDEWGGGRVCCHHMQCARRARRVAESEFFHRSCYNTSNCFTICTIAQTLSDYMLIALLRVLCSLAMCYVWYGICYIYSWLYGSTIEL